MANNTKYTALLIEDDAASSNLLELMLGKYCPHVEVVAKAADNETALAAVQQQQPDIILADIVLGACTFFDAFTPEFIGHGKLVFVTGYEEFALQAIKSEAVDYLLKPIQPQQLIQAVGKCARLLELEQTHGKTLQKNEHQDKLLIKTARGIHVLEMDEIIRCESESGYTSFVLRDKKRVVASKTLKEVEETLPWPSHFMRVHQSHFINLHFAGAVLKTPSGYQIQMADEAHVPVSAAKKAVLQRWLDSMRAL